MHTIWHACMHACTVRMHAGNMCVHAHFLACIHAVCMHAGNACVHAHDFGMHALECVYAAMGLGMHALVHACTLFVYAA